MGPRLSSRIEGLQASAQEVALAEPAAVEAVSIAGLTENGRLVANNFDLLTLTERRLAGTRWDTRDAKPSRPVRHDRSSADK